MKSLRLSTAFWRWATVLALLGGVFLRWASLGPASTMLHHDEAWNGVDAVAMLREPHLTPFLTRNFGRESGWVYWLLPYLLAFGATAFALRLAATVTGILTLAAAGRLGRELMEERGAFWGVAALSVFYWHVHLSHLALRANLYVLMGTLAAATMLSAYRTNSRRAWMACGLVLGLLGHTYFASAAWIGFLLLLVVGVALLDRRRRRGALLALLLFALLMVPLSVFFLRHSAQLMRRPTTVAVASTGGLVHNAQRWLEAFFHQGDPKHLFNLPGRPILGPLAGTLAALGLLGLAVSLHRWTYGLLLVGWALAACLPSLLSNLAPHFLRASGMTVPIALIIGIGAALLGSLLQRLSGIRLVASLPALLLLLVGVATYRDFHLGWIRHPDTYLVMEQHVNRAVDDLRDHASSAGTVYFSPFRFGHPVVTFRGVDLAPKRIAAFDSHQCLVLSDHGADYVSLTMYEPSFEDRLARLADVALLSAEGGTSASRPRYSVFSARGDPDSGRRVATFGDALALRQMQPLSTTLAPGDELPVVLGVRPLRPLDFAPSLFVHIYGVPTPYEGGVLWAQADSQLCPSYPAHLWRSEEMIVQSFDLQLPPDIPAGEYIVAVGVYVFPDRERLPVSASGDPEQNYVELHRMTIRDEE